MPHVAAPASDPVARERKRTTMSRSAVIIEARRVGQKVLFFPQRWRFSGEYAPLVYDGADPKMFSTFEDAEACCLRYENRDDSMISPRWDVDAAEWVERSDEARGVWREDEGCLAHCLRR